MDEYDRNDAAYYDARTQGVAGDVAFYVEQARQAGSPCLEIGCGTGRITLPAALAGVEVTGLDRAPSMLAICREKTAALPADVAGRVTLVEGDMRSFNLETRFALIFIPFRAFMHCLTVEDQLSALTHMRRHLAPDGRLVFNCFDPRISALAAGSKAGGPGKKLEHEFTHPTTGNRVLLWTTTTHDPLTQVLDQVVIYEELARDGTIGSRTWAPLRLRWTYRFEMVHLLQRAGLKVEALHGDFEGGPFRHGVEQVWFCSAAD